MDYNATNKARERTPIHKAKGVTISERYLNRLCEKSFLSLWSYPGVFRDQGKSNDGHGKEICDLLVVCGEHVIIFSDKDLTFPNTGNLEVDWKRWYKRAIKKSAEQAWGAERWIKTYPERVFLDRQCTQPFPLQIPSPEIAKYHLIIVAHGCEDRCKKELGGRGSLKLESVADKGAKPFTIGDLDENKTFVHVLNDSTLDVVLDTLDTITDFVEYLEKKEALFRIIPKVLASGEEDLLAIYLKKINDDGDHDFIIPKLANSLVIEEGQWENFCQRPERVEQLRQDKISYLWDDLIERFSRHAMNATQYYTNHIELSDTEIALRFMAKESRFTRRIISKRLLKIYTNTPNGTKRVGAVVPSDPSNPYYVFLAFPQPDFIDYEKYRDVRGSMLEACCMVTKYKFPDAQDIVGIASEPVQSGNSSEDLIYLDASIWTKDNNEEAKNLQENLNILVSPKKEYINDEEYPDSPMPLMVTKKIGRNEKCPCGSGKKYKHCHWKVKR